MSPATGAMCRGQGAAAEGGGKEERMAAAIRTLLRGIGEDLEREGLVDTPKRVAKALLEVSRGYRQLPTSALGDALFHEPAVREGGQGVVLVRDIEFASTAEDSLLPFHGRCHIAYVPSHGTIIGLSKLARLTKLMAKRLTSQERLGTDVSLALQRHLSCQGVAVVILATHMALAGPAPPQEHLTVCVHGCFAEPHTLQLQMLMDMLGLPAVPASRVQLAPCSPDLSHAAANGGSCGSITAAPRSASTLSSCGESVAVDCSSKECELSDKDGSLDGEERLSSMSTEEGERLGVCMDWDGEHSAAAGKGAQHSSVREDTCKTQPPQQLTPSSSYTALMEAAVQDLLVEMGECPTRAGLQGSAQRYVATLLASTSGYRQQLPSHSSSNEATTSTPTSTSSQHQEHQQRQLPPQQAAAEQRQRTGSSSCSCCSEDSHHSVCTTTCEESHTHSLWSSEDAGTAGRGVGQRVHGSAAFPSTTATTAAADAHLHTGMPVCSTAGRGAVPSSCAAARRRSKQPPAHTAASSHHQDAAACNADEQAGCASQQGLTCGGEGLQLCCVSVPFNSQCEHHMLPFYGCASIVLVRHASSTGSVSCSEGGCGGAQQDACANGRGMSSSKSVEEGGSSKRGRGAVRSGRTRGSVGSIGVADSAAKNSSSIEGGSQEPQTRGESERSASGVKSSGAVCAANAQRAVRSASADERQVIEAVVSVYTQRLQVQERITHQVADAVAAKLDAAGVVVVVDAAHMCMVARGVENHAGRTTTMASRGLARDDAALCRQALLVGSRQQRERGAAASLRQ